MYKRLLALSALSILLSFFPNSVAFAQDETPDPIKEEEHIPHLEPGTDTEHQHEDVPVKEYDAAATTMHHLEDSYSWDFWKQHGHYVGIQLPRIFWDRVEGGFRFFWTTTAAEEAGWVDIHEDQYEGLHHFTTDLKHGLLLHPSAESELLELQEGLQAGEIDESTVEARIDGIMAEYKPLDLSFTKNVLYMMFASLLMILIFIPMAKQYKENANRPPKGIAKFFEPIVVFIRDDIAKQNIPHQWPKFMPLLLTLFFFIWFLNMLGLTPFSANVTGNLSVTTALAVVTLFAVNISGNKHYWEHIFWFPGVPVALKPLMFIVEFIGIFTKPFALTVRLFANITAGHVIILSLVGLIFILGEMGANPVAGYGVSVVSTIFILFIDVLELFVAILQAYVFTLLSAVFIGQATADLHGEHHEEATAH